MTMMRSSVIIQVSKSILMFVWSLLQRIICCKRRRRPSKDHPGWIEDEQEPMLTSITVETSRPTEGLQSWNTWGEDYREPTVADKIEAYRAALKPAPEDNPTEDVDFFSDMTPKVSKQTRVYVGPVSKGAPSNRLAFQGSAVVEPESEILGTWDESTGWDAEDDGVSQLVREQRRQQKRLNSQ